jgi:hypothetical protein
MRNIFTAILFVVTSVANATPSGYSTTIPILSINDGYNDAQYDFYGEAFAGSRGEFVGVGFFNYVAGEYFDGSNYVIDQTVVEDLFFTFKYDDVNIDRSSTIRPYNAYNGSLTVWEMKEGTQFKATGNYYDDYAYIKDNSVGSETIDDISASGEYVMHEWLTSHTNVFTSYPDLDIDLNFQMVLGQGANGYNYHGHSAPPSSVPVPGAVWLFGTGLIGLIARRNG